MLLPTEAEKLAGNIITTSLPLSAVIPGALRVAELPLLIEPVGPE